MRSILAVLSFTISFSYSQYSEANESDKNYYQPGKNSLEQVDRENKSSKKVKVILELESAPTLKIIRSSKASLSSPIKNKAQGKSHLQKEKTNQSNLLKERKARIQSHVQKVKVEQANVLKELQAKGLSNKFNRQFHYLYNGLSLEVEPEKLSQLEKIKGVKKVHRVSNLAIHIDDSVPLVNADQAWQLTESGFSGFGVKVAVLDTGVDYTRTELGGCFGEGCRVEGGYDFLDDDDDPMDVHGHGTHVTGILAANGDIKGVAPDVTIYAYKVCDSECPNDAVLAALEHAIDPDGDPLTDDGVDIINMSLGGPGELDDPLTVAVNELANENVLVVTSAGNDGRNGGMTIDTPANAEKALTVAATDKHDDIAETSSRGPIFSEAFQKPEISAPGKDISSLSLGDGVELQSGTSMAAPHVAGAAALIKQRYPHLTGQEIKSLLVTHADAINSPFTLAGAGRLNALNALESVVLTSKNHLLFERLDRSQEKWESQQSVEIKNISQESITVALAIENDEPAVSYSFGEVSEIVLAAGASENIIIDVEIELDNLTSASDLIHRANLTLSTNNNEANLPLLLFDAVKLDWSLDRSGKSIWIHELNGGTSFKSEYVQEGTHYLAAGDYLFSAFIQYFDQYAVIVKELNNFKADNTLSFVKSDAIHKVQVESFIDHAGNNQSVENLYGGFSFFELANPKTLSRQYVFSDWWNSGYLIQKPLLISDIPKDFEFNFSLLAGGKGTSSYDYHTYAYSNSVSNLTNDFSITLDGTLENKVEFDVTIPEFNTGNFDWVVTSWIDHDPYEAIGWLVNGASLFGPLPLYSTTGNDFFNDAFKLTLHGNGVSNERIGHYNFKVQDSSNIRYQSSQLRFESEATASIYESISFLSFSTLLKTLNSSVYPMKGEGIFPTYLSGYIIDWSDDAISLNSFYSDSNYSHIPNKAHHNAWILVCSDLAIRYFSAPDVYETEDVGDSCLNKMIHHRFYNYQLGNKQLSSYLTTSKNPSRIYNLDASNILDNSNSVNQEENITIKIQTDNTDILEGIFSAYINYQGQWQEINTGLIQSETEGQKSYFTYQIDIPAVESVVLTSLKLSYIKGQHNFTLTLPNAYVLGGSEEDIMAMDRDDDGVADGIDNDLDNDDIPNDYELINGLNHLDSSDALGDLNDNGISNLDDYLAGNIISLLANDSDEDGIADHVDAFPSNSNESLDTDNDGIGNNSDTDDDNDGVEDSDDTFPLDASESLDTDNDGIGNNSDTDDDNDGVEDGDDTFPIDASESLDTDNDGIGNNNDTDDDNDGVEDSDDTFPLDSGKSINTDNDITVELKETRTISREQNKNSGGGSSNLYILLILFFIVINKRVLIYKN